MISEKFLGRGDLASHGTMTPNYLSDQEIKVTRVRITADAELRRRVKIAAVRTDRSVSEWIEGAVRRELERERTRTSETVTISRASVPAFARDWNSEDDAVYDELA